MSHNRRKLYTVTLEDLPPGAVVAMKRAIWDAAGSPDVEVPDDALNGQEPVRASLSVDIVLTDLAKERLLDFLSDGWVMHNIQERPCKFLEEAQRTREDQES